MATTPEGIVKKAIDKLIAKYNAYRFMPVPSGYGASSLDYIVCCGGKFAAIEAKAPGKKPSALQKVMIRNIELAYGRVFVIDNILGDEMQKLEEWLFANSLPPRMLPKEVSDAEIL